MSVATFTSKTGIAPGVLAQPDVYEPEPPAPPVKRAPGRLVSLDAYRGLVMVLMISAGLGIGQVVKNFDKTEQFRSWHTTWWDKAAYEVDHARWVGCTLWDLIQPSFMFVVGTAMAFSIANRQARGQSFGRLLFHALKRSLILILLSIFLASAWHARPNYSFTIVLAQIGLGYPFLFLLSWLKPRWQLVAAIVILAGYWAAFAAYPKPPAELDPASVRDGNPQPWVRLQGFDSHWEKGNNIATRFDKWFLNLFPPVEKGKPFTYENGGYQTLNFVPSLATMIFGLLAGELLLAGLSGSAKFGVLLLAAAIGFASGYALDHFGLCPMVKRIWTPSFALFSAGWTFLTLGLFYLVIDLWRIKFWSYPLVVVGANSILIYCVSMLLKPFVRDNMHRFFGRWVYLRPIPTYAYVRYHLLTHQPYSPDYYWALGGVFAPMTEFAVFLLVCWIICWWMYRNKLFVKI